MEENKESMEEDYWLVHFPIMFFASVMGVGGLSLVVNKSIDIFELHESLGWLSVICVAISVALLVAIVGLYGLKIIKYPKAFLKELKHPVRINFFAAVSVSILIVLMLVLPYIGDGFALVLFWIGALLQLIFSLYVVKYWFVNEMKQKMASPAWFIPIVGNLIVPLAGMKLNIALGDVIVSYEVLIFYFGMGTFFWILLGAGLLFRLIFGENLPQKFLPTLFIFIAPPSIFGLDVLLMFNDFISMGSSYVIASASFSVALFFIFLMASIFNVFLNIKFALSWWAFTFPIAAFTLCSLELYITSYSPIYKVFGILGGVLCAVIVFVVGFRTLIAIKNREICVIEE
ncbi:SLAC1 anion channel family protein [Helicobacter sp.]|uniref:SLAC1 anion channel family protein n=1 Tax=Helicobacter sp. TaxID=218 RepID=UPI0025905CB7|nr:SLAC1 anion channel family protein [Helicobacter sp.]MCI7047980.1 SLAC1 anion channel family protein [Helicobacter sp.]MCI7765318.1 SLAC1 anion channel family protein [Helicobacter sp.]MDY5615456.1 SLAC1 anion channel family protein [Helicobacter sp.]